MNAAVGNVSLTSDIGVFGLCSVGFGFLIGITVAWIVIGRLLLEGLASGRVMTVVVWRCVR